MRVRAVDPVTGDMTWGAGSANFLIDSPQFVLQKILTGLKLWQGEYFLNTAAGMPWSTQVLGMNTQAFYDAAIQAQVKATTGVTGITSYASSLNAATRALSVSMVVSTKFGTISVNQTFAPPLTGGYGVPSGLGYGQ